MKQKIRPQWCLHQTWTSPSWCQSLLSWPEYVRTGQTKCQAASLFRTPGLHIQSHLLCQLPSVCWTQRNSEWSGKHCSGQSTTGSRLHWSSWKSLIHHSTYHNLQSVSRTASRNQCTWPARMSSCLIIWRDIHSFIDMLKTLSHCHWMLIHS